MQNSKISQTAGPSRNMSDSTNTVEKIELKFGNSLKRVAENDRNGFNELMNCLSYAINELGVWYRDKTNSDELFSTFLLMMAASSGNLAVLKFILSNVNVNAKYGSDETTALHGAASSWSHNAMDVVKTLLEDYDADPDLVDGLGRRPVDVVCLPKNLELIKFVIEEKLEKKTKQNEQHPVEVPDFKSDEFRMFEYKIHPCEAGGKSHKWIECPLYHSDKQDKRRRDPRKFRYSSDLCSEFKKGRVCEAGDLCGFAHGNYERGLHPERYRTRFCSEKLCTQKVCFYAHTKQELRPRHASATMSAITSPPVRAGQRPSSSIRFN